MTMSPEPETSRDSDNLDQNSEDTVVEIDDLKQQAITTVSAIDDPLMNAFRDLLRRYMDKYSTDISEIAVGLQLSRPVLTEFLNRTKGRNHLPLSPGRICNLHTELTRSEKLDSKRRRTKSNKSIKETRTRSQEARSQLKKDGADELLITAGFQPRKMKMVPVSPLQYSQLSFISFLYGERPLSQDVFSQITKQEMDRIEIELTRKINQEIQDSKQQRSKKELILKDKLDELNKASLLNKLSINSWINQETKDNVDKEYHSSIELMDTGSLTLTESTGLFKSVLINQLTKDEGFDLNLTVIGVERTSLSLPWKIKKNVRENASELLNDIEIIGHGCEALLKNSYKEEAANNSQTCSVYPITKTVINCKYGSDSNDIIKFECVSRGTHVNTAFSAISQNMGFRHSISTLKMDITWLGKDIRSLIDVVVTIGGKSSGELVSGECVSADLLQSLLQAMIIAGNKWFYKNFSSQLSTTEYKSIIKKTAKLRAVFYEKRLAFDEYDFDDSIVNVNEFRKISDKAKENTNNLLELSTSTETWDTFLYTFRRIHVLAQLYSLHHYNVQVNHTECYRLIGEIQDELNKPKSNEAIFLIPARISLCVEKIAYNLSFGIAYNNESLTQPIHGTIDYLLKDNLFKIEDVCTHFDKIHEIIKEDIKRCIYSDEYLNNPGYDIYHSLASYHSIIGRVLFYVGKNKKDLDLAFDRFLRAAYYFQRIGLSRKVQRSLTLAGRVKVRAKEKKYVGQCEELSHSLLEEGVARLNMLDDEKFSLSVKSRLNLLKGEHSLIIDKNKEEGLQSCLNALKGALWLGLNRHIVDVLYTISLCTEDLYDREIKEDLEKIFPELWDNVGIPGLIRGRGDNKIAKRVVRELLNNRILLDQPRGKSVCWNITTEELKTFSANIWNGWYRNATGEPEGEHPFSIEIREGRFLKPI
jgi:hypothetical protein